MKLNKFFLVISLLLLGSYIQSSTYLKTQNNDNTEILSKILKEIEELKKGQERLSNDIKTLKASGNNNQKQGNANASTIKNVPIGNSVVLGNPNAPVTIIKGTDFQWPYCAKSVSLVDEVLAKYPNDVKVVIKNYPLSFHKQARKAAKYALAAGRQGKYKEMYHMIMADFRKLKNNEDLPLDFAETLGLDIVKFKKDAEDPYFENLIKRESLELSQNFERKSVPKFLVAGKEPSSRNVDAWSAIIDAELAKKK